MKNSATRILLDSYADDFTKTLGFKCLVHSGGSANVYAIAELMEGGGRRTLTAFTDGINLIRICQAFLDGYARGKRDATQEAA